MKYLFFVSFILIVSVQADQSAGYVWGVQVQEVNLNSKQKGKERVIRLSEKETYLKEYLNLNSYNCFVSKLGVAKEWRAESRDLTCFNKKNEHFGRFITSVTCAGVTKSQYFQSATVYLGEKKGLFVKLTLYCADKDKFSKL